VHQGIKHFKAGTTVEAFQCLNQALTIDPQNVEGLVARGKKSLLLKDILCQDSNVVLSSVATITVIESA
jgi:hypothetical protein